MKLVLPVVLASIAAIGNALFAYGQKQPVTVSNRLLYVSASALTASLFALFASPMAGEVQFEMLSRNWKLIFVSGLGLFLTYLGFNLLYSQFGVTSYVLYAVISVITTTLLVGSIILRETVNGYQVAAIITAIVAVVLFALGQRTAVKGMG